MGERIAVDDHARFVRSLLAPLGARPTERVPLDEALGRITASPVESPIPLPPFRNAQMDGFAARAADLAGASMEAPVVLRVVGEVAAAPGAPGPLVAGTVVRIMTGAPVPDGADAVVPVEDTESADDGTTVRIIRSRAAGEYVREAGSDLAAGADVLPAGMRLEPRHLAAAAASGLAELLVRERVRVAVVSTGSELVAPGERLGPGEIPDANGVALVAAVRAAGAVVSHSARLLSALQDDERCNAVQLSKEFGETVVQEQGLLDRPSWHWPER